MNLVLVGRVRGRPPRRLLTRFPGNRLVQHRPMEGEGQRHLARVALPGHGCFQFAKETGIAVMSEADAVANGKSLGRPRERLPAIRRDAHVQRRVDLRDPAGSRSGIALFRQAALVIMLQSLVPTLLGLTLTRALAFPLFYLFFMVPVGEELVPMLQILTAKMSMAMLGWAGVPAHIEGIFITTPNGYYKVAEACAGVKFLVAMVAYGALVAHVCFRSWPRRIVFMGQR